MNISIERVCVDVLAIRIDRRRCRRPARAGVMFSCPDDVAALRIDGNDAAAHRAEDEEIALSEIGDDVGDVDRRSVGDVG